MTRVDAATGEYRKAVDLFEGFAKETPEGLEDFKDLPRHFLTSLRTLQESLTCSEGRGFDGSRQQVDQVAPSVNYEFHREVEAPNHAPPVGAGGSTDGRWYQSLRIEALKPGKRQQTTRIGDESAERIWYVTRGLDLHEGGVTGAPLQTRCPPADVQPRKPLSARDSARRPTECRRSHPLRRTRVYARHSRHFQRPLRHGLRRSALSGSRGLSKCRHGT